MMYPVMVTPLVGYEYTTFPVLYNELIGSVPESELPPYPLPPLKVKGGLPSALLSHIQLDVSLSFQPRHERWKRTELS